MVWMFAIREMLQGTPQHSDLQWIPFAILRSSMKGNFPGGYSQAMRVLLHQLFVVDQVQDKGFMMPTDDGPIEVFLKLANVIADGDAWRTIFSVKGASGKLPCICCLNVTTDLAAIRRNPGRLHGLGVAALSMVSRERSRHLGEN